MTFCSRYLQNTKNQPCASASHLPYLKIVGLPLSGPYAYELSYITWIQAHRYVLMNYPHIIPFVEYVGNLFFNPCMLSILVSIYRSLILLSFWCREHLNELSANKKNKRENERAHHSSFHNWFSDHVSTYNICHFGLGYHIVLTSLNF